MLVKSIPQNGGTVPPPLEAAKKSISQAKNLAIPKSTPVPVKPTSSGVSSGTTVAAKTIPQNNFNIPSPTKQYSNPQLNDWSTKQQELFKQLQNTINTPFSYDPEKDPAYQAQRQLAQQRAGVASQNALESANDRGILGSSMTVSQLGQIQQAAEQEALAYIPQYREQAYSQHLDRISNAEKLINVGRNLRADNFGEAYDTAQLTGNFISPEATQLYNNLIELKSTTEKNWSNMTPEQRAAASQEGDRIRNQLAGMGVDISKIGSDIRSNQASANLGSVGTRTLAGQQFDLTGYIDNRNFNYGVQRDQRQDFVTDREFEYNAGRDAVSDEKWLTEFNERVRQFGMSNALQWAQQSVSQYNAQTSRMNHNLNAQEFGYRQQQDALDRTSSSSSTTSKNYSYKTDPEFASAVKDLNSNFESNKQLIQYYPDEFINAFGYDGYQELLSIIKQKEDSSANYLRK